MTVRSLVTEPLRIHGYRDRDRHAEAKRLLELVGLSEDFGRRYPHQLSGGQARRVGLARAVALEPRLIIADEPTAGLDVSVQGEVLNLVARLQQELGLAILIITHNLNLVRHITDRMAIMYLGRFVEQGPPRPSSPARGTPTPRPCCRRARSPTRMPCRSASPCAARSPASCAGRAAASSIPAARTPATSARWTRQRSPTWAAATSTPATTP
jgi:energy-coupling factor transporter ATP-binding protein EcfA2